MVVGLDIGTSYIRVAIGDYDENGKFRILGTSCEKSMGLRNGNIVNIEAASNAIRNAIDNAEQNAGVDIVSCYVSVGGDQIEGENATGKVAVSPKGKSQREVSKDDIERVIESATAVQIAMDRERLHVITQDYIVDGISGIKDPMHRLGVCLEAAVHIITASRTTIQNIRSCINRAGYMMNGVMLKTLAAQKAVATEDEKELGSIIVDMGAGTTDILVLVHDAPVYTASIPVGGNMVTNDIAIVKGIPVAEAERIKIEYGCCWMENISPDATLIINGIGGRPPEEITQAELCDIIMPRMEEIFTMVLNKIIEKTNLTQLSGNIILTGAGARMDGIIELVQNVFGTSAVRIGLPERLGGIEENYEGPEWATAMGLVLACKDDVKHHDLKKSRKHLSSEKEGKGGNIVKRFLKSLF